MIRAEVRTVAKRCIVCPHCDATAGQVDHLGAGAKTFWYCDACGMAYGVEIAKDGSVWTEKRTERKVTTVDLLVLKPQEKPVYFIVEGMRFEPSDHDTAESRRFFYESHSCPTNWLQPEMVYHEGDADPHGLIEFVATRDDAAFPKPENHGPSDRDFALQTFIESSSSKSS